MSKRFSESDYAYGKKKEEQYMPIIGDFFGEKLSAVEDKTCEYDFIGESGEKYELKSFRNYSFRPFVPVIDQQKIESNKKHNTTFILAFVNPEELYYIKYDKALFDTFKRETIMTLRGYPNKIVRIPHEYLKPIPMSKH